MRKKLQEVKAGEEEEGGEGANANTSRTDLSSYRDSIEDGGPSPEVIRKALREELRKELDELES